jgi:hypothetical protein
MHVYMYMCMYMYVPLPVTVSAVTLPSGTWENETAGTASPLPLLITLSICPTLKPPPTVTVEPIVAVGPGGFGLVGLGLALSEFAEVDATR